MTFIDFLEGIKIRNKQGKIVNYFDKEILGTKFVDEDYIYKTENGDIMYRYKNLPSAPLIKKLTNEELNHIRYFGNRQTYSSTTTLLYSLYKGGNVLYISPDSNSSYSIKDKYTQLFYNNSIKSSLNIKFTDIDKCKRSGKQYLKRKDMLIFDQVLYSGFSFNDYYYRSYNDIVDKGKKIIELVS